MKTFKVDAIIRCTCEICAGTGIKDYDDKEAREENSIAEGVRFSDTFSAQDGDAAVELAKAKFLMIQDDLKEEFEGDGHRIVLEIEGYDEL